MKVSSSTPFDKRLLATDIRMSSVTSFVFSSLIDGESGLLAISLLSKLKDSLAIFRPRRTDLRAARESFRGIFPALRNSSSRPRKDYKGEIRTASVYPRSLESMNEMNSFIFFVFSDLILGGRKSCSLKRNHRNLKSGQ